MKPASYVMLALLILGAMLLFIYPFAVFVNLGGSTGHYSSDEPLSLFVTYSLCIASFAYPVIYFVCAIVAVSKDKKGDSRTAVWYAVGPLVYLLLVTVVLTVWVVRG